MSANTVITKDTVVVGTTPRISAEQFAEILLDADSPAAPDAFAMYTTAIAQGVDPAFFLAVFREESQMATDPDSMVLKHKTFNPGNCRTSSIGTLPILPTEKGPFVVYPDWIKGTEDACHRLIDGRYPYAQAKAKTIAQIIPIWAPSSENDTQRYISNVVSFMNEWVGGASMATPQQFFIQWRGTNDNNFWAGREGESVVAICDHIMQGTEESSDGWFKNPNSQVSAHFGVAKDGRIWQWVDMANRAWANGIPESPDMSVPFIADAINRKKNPNDFTVSIEHEGNTGDVIPEAQYQATLWLHRYIMSKYPAIKPDRNHIIGHYQISAKSRPNCPGKGFPWTRLMNDLTNGGSIVLTTDSHTPLPQQPTGLINGKTIGGGFKTFYDKLAAVSPNFQLLVLGLPVTNEFDCDVDGNGKATTVQLFERGFLVYESAAPTPWDVHVGTTAQLDNVLAAAKAKSLTN
jgi:N-acetyl-anhydromuramyl-L-alanine amidase AmpD